MNKHTLFFLVFFSISNSLFSQIDHWETAIYASDIWKYRMGTSNPPANWKSLSFNEAGWQQGMGGIGYGDGDDLTVISPVVSLYMRRKFAVADLSKIEMAILHADYDDAFVAYINGVEVARSNNIQGAPPAFNAAVGTEHEAVLYSGGLPDAFILDNNILGQIPLAAENVLAIQVHNFNGLNSSDLSSNFFLSFAKKDATTEYGPTPDWFVSPFFTSHLPIIHINTNGVYIPDEPSIPAEMGVIWNGAGQLNSPLDPPNDFLGNITIERRGQSSLWLFPKNGFAIETKDGMGEDMDTSFLNFPKEEDWVLHGPYSDKTLMRNVLAMHIAEGMGQYASRTRFVELFINGQYEGIYVVMEKIKQDKNRVDIADLKEEDVTGDELTGGYVFKIDKDEADWFSTFNMVNSPGEKLQFQYVSPKASKIQPAQANYIQSYVDSFERAVANIGYMYGGKRYDEYIDLASFADHFIISEVSKNVDGYRISSYFHKDKNSKGGKIKAGPVWDFNLGFGNADYCDGGNPGGGWVYDVHCGNSNPFWWLRMFQDATFRNLVKCRWAQFRQGHLHVDSLFAFIDGQADYLAPAVGANFDRWPILQEYVWPNATVPGSYQGEIDYLKSFLGQRIAYMDDYIFGVCAPTDVAEQSVSPFFKVFPNPAMGRLQIEFFEKNKAPEKVSFINAIGGQVTLQAPIHLAGTWSVGTEHLAAGVYYLQVETDSQVWVEKVVLLK